MKYKGNKSTKTPLSDRIADALTVKPRADIEDDQVFRTKPQTVSRADFSSDSEDDAAISDFRKRNIDLLSKISKKYEGEVVSRKNADQTDSSHSYEESDSEGDFPSLHAKVESSDDDGSIINSKESKGSENNEESASENLSLDVDSDNNIITKFHNNDSHVEDESDADEEDDDEGKSYDISQLEEPMKEEFEHVTKQNITEEAKKGASVRNQLLIWEGFLEMRIHLQRCLNTANQMPVPDAHEELKKNGEFFDECNITKTNISNVLEKFLTLQNMLFKSFPETKTLSLKNQTAKEKTEDSDEEIPSDTDNEEIPSDTDEEVEVAKETKPTKKVDKNNGTKKRKLEDYEKEIAMSHKAFKTFRDSTIQKWNDKTRLATATNIKHAPTNTVLQQISYIMSDREKLVRRTQLKRSEYNIIGYKKVAESEDQNASNLLIPVTKDRKDDDEYIPEIFDDSDFYHQLLRELIECKSADISDPVQLSRQWIALQQMRSKMKRKVDTKATKGRKIKYVVHNQLVNYMAPEKCTTWTEEATNELYSSLFGKMFEHNNVGLNATFESGFKLKN